MKVYNSVKEFREYVDRDEIWGDANINVYMTS